MNSLLSSPSLSTGEGKSCNLWYVINTGIREGGELLAPCLRTGRDRMKFFTRANIAVPRTLEKRFPASFSKASRKRKKRNYPPRLKRLDMKISVEQVYIYIYIRSI